jgi:hypothetical protein
MIVVAPFPCLSGQEKAVNIKRINTKGTSGGSAGVMLSKNSFTTRGSRSIVSGKSSDQLFELTAPSHFSSVQKFAS